MNVTKEIMQLLNIGITVAKKVQTQMICNGVDFSECTKRQFNKEVREAYKELHYV